MSDDNAREYADEYVLLGNHAEILSSGRSVAVGERISGDELGPEDGYLVDDERLVDVESFDEGPAQKLTGKALEARAAELEIEGRSDMKADELRDAIAAHEAELAAAGGDQGGSAAGGDE